MGRLGNEWLDEECKVLQQNPKRGKSADRYDLYKKATTLGEILDLGGSRPDIQNDIIRGYVVLTDKNKHRELLAILKSKDADSPPAKAPTPKLTKPPVPLPKIKPPFAPATTPKQQQQQQQQQPKLPAPKEPTKPPLDLRPVKPRERPPPPPETNHKKRLLAANKARVRKFGRTVGRGRLLPFYEDES